MNKRQIELLKEKINPARDNEFYQAWLQTDRSQKFRSFVIDSFLLE